MSEKHPFQLRDHGHKIIEIILHDPEIKPDHKAVATLQLLTKKFEQIILTLEETASLSPDLLPVLLKVGEFGALKIVAPNDEQISFDLHGILVFKNTLSAIRRIVGERKAEMILKQIGRMGLSRTTAYSLLQMMRNPEVKFEEIEEVTAKDPELEARMLKTANTAYFSRRIPIENLKTAVTYLGLEGIRQLLIHELFDSFTRFFLHQRDKLGHMRRCSHLAAYLGKTVKADLPTIGKMRVAGLMHDLGSLAFAFYDSQEYQKVLNMVRREQVSTYEAEARIFGVSHQYLGALYAKELGMPDYVVSAIEKHHDSEIDEENLVLMSVVCANGFLNEKIEKIHYSEYDHLLTRLAAEIDAKNPDLQKARKAAEQGSPVPETTDADSEEASEDQVDADEKQDDAETDAILESLQGSFKPMQFYGLLKEELDQFILAGAGAGK